MAVFQICLFSITAICFQPGFVLEKDRLQFCSGGAIFFGGSGIGITHSGIVHPENLLLQVLLMKNITLSATGR
jgi:hypothetical protein